MVRIWITWVGE